MDVCRIQFVVPGAPSPKGRPIAGKTQSGKIVMRTPKKTEQREGVVAALAAQAMAGQPPLDGAVTLLVKAVFEVPKSWPLYKKTAAEAGALHPTGRPDLDNIVKLVSDGCNGIVWGDDSQIVSIIARKEYGFPARVAVAAYTGAAPQRQAGS